MAKEKINATFADRTPIRTCYMQNSLSMTPTHKPQEERKKKDVTFTDIRTEFSERLDSSSLLLSSKLLSFDEV